MDLVDIIHDGTRVGACTQDISRDMRTDRDRAAVFLFFEHIAAQSLQEIVALDMRASWGGMCFYWLSTNWPWVVTFKWFD